MSSLSLYKAASELLKTSQDLEYYKSLYDAFDPAHDRRHMEQVRDMAVQLAEKHDPGRKNLAELAAVLHDVGLKEGKPEHGETGTRMIQEDENLKSQLSDEDMKDLLHAVKEHRASTGRPQSVLAKIISDADRVPASAQESVRRSRDWHQGDLQKALEHLQGRYSDKGTGRRVYFPETRKKLEETTRPILEAQSPDDLRRLLGERIQ